MPVVQRLNQDSGPMGEHHIWQCRRWRDQQTTLWRLVGKVTGWKAGRCTHLLISELCSIQECDRAVMDILACTEVGKFPLK